MHKFLAALLIVTSTLTGVAQQAAPLSKREVALKQQAYDLPAHARITVIPMHAKEEYGNFITNDDQSLTFYDVDRNAEVTLTFAEVRKIKEGYGSYNSAQGTHTNHKKAIVIVLIVTASLAALIAAAATAR